MDLSLRTKGSLLAVLGTAAVLGVLALTIALAWPEDSASAKANYCNSLDNLATTVVNYQGLNPATATNDQLESAADDINSAWNDVVDDANDWANAYDNPLGNAVDDLAYAIDGLPGDNTIAQDIDDLQPELSALPGAFRETFDGSGCGSA